MKNLAITVYVVSVRVIRLIPNDNSKCKNL